MSDADILVAGGGIVGMATARALQTRLPGVRVTVFEQESELASHQSGRNSGVLHSGLYYTPGSFKARFAREGNRRLREFCRERGLPLNACGKVLAAVTDEEEERLAGLAERARENEVEARMLTADELREREPEVRARAALLVPSAALVDFRAITAALAEDVRAAGGIVRTGVRVLRAGPGPRGVRVVTGEGSMDVRYLAGCAGLWADRLARACGLVPPARLLPFRGEYWVLRGRASCAVRHLVYPVPDPALPFLGVHLTRTLDGAVRAGPNAVLAFARDGYRLTRVRFRDLAEALAYPGFWRLIGRMPKTVISELARSSSRCLVARAVRRLVPAVRAADLARGPTGVRAQAIFPDGTFAEDFLTLEGEGMLHVLNAPSPAATAALPIADHLAGRIAVHFE